MKKRSAALLGVLAFNHLRANGLPDTGSPTRDVARPIPALVDTEPVQADTPPPTRLIALDLLRALAIVLVLFAHCPNPGESEVPGFLAPLLGALKQGGWVGVDLFFVLSGFLVSGLLMREHQRHGSVKIGRFLVRRGWKIYPPMIAFVLFMVAYDRGTLGFWPTDRFVATALFIQNYVPGMRTHLWSLAVEEHAYLLIAFAFGLCALIARRRKAVMNVSWIPWAIGALLVTVLALRLHNAANSSFGFFTHQFPTHLRIDGILAGVLGAYVYQYHSQTTAALLRRFRQPMLLLGVALMLPPFIWTRDEATWLYTYGLTTNYLGGLCILGGSLGCQPASHLVTRAIAAIGRHSYSIYLWHMTAYALLLWAITGNVVAKPTWDGPFALQFVLFMAAGVGLGIVLSVLIEVPTLKLRDRLSPSRGGTLEPVAGGDNQTGPARTKGVIAGASGG